MQTPAAFSFSIKYLTAELVKEECSGEICEYTFLISY